MSRAKCKHPPDHVVIKYDCDSLPDPLELSWRECLDCDEWLSMGPSNDASEAVQIEIRAAEIAAGLDDGGCMVSFSERCGFNDETPTYELRNGQPITLDIQLSATHAGYLARAICTTGGKEE